MQKNPGTPEPKSPSKLRTGKENTSTPNSPYKRERGQEVDSLGSPDSKKNRPRRIGLSISNTVRSRKDDNSGAAPVVAAEDFQIASSILRPPQQEPEQIIPMEDAENLLALAEDVVEPEQNNQPPQRQAEVVPVLVPVPVNPAVVSHFSTYQNSDIECPRFLSAAGNNAHKIIIEQLHANNGARFLSLNSRGGRCWNNYPSHEITFIQPKTDPHDQIYFPSSSKDIVYKGTWVSAVVREVTGEIYPLHIITKNTLGAVKYLMGYPAKIAKLFQHEEFITAWPRDMGKECLVICVDNVDQRRSLVRDYEQLVMNEGQNAMQKVPNIRVYYRGELSELMTVEGCRQRNIFAVFAVAKPNLLPYHEKKQSLLNIEEVEVKARQGALSLDDFNDVCQRFLNPAPVSHELALTHFSLTQVQEFCGVLIQSRERMINLKGKLYAQYKGPQIHDAEFQRFVTEINGTIAVRTGIISKLTALIGEYLEFSRRLSYLLKLAPVPTIANIQSVEENIYAEIRSLLEQSNVDAETIQSQFSTGKALCTWLLTKKINIPLNNPAELIHEMLEHFPRPENQMVRVF